MSAKPKTLRLPDALLERLERIAKMNATDLSTAMRFAIQRGVKCIEEDLQPPAPRPSTENPPDPLVSPSHPAQRRVLSPGVR